MLSFSEMKLYQNPQLFSVVVVVFCSQFSETYIHHKLRLGKFTISKINPPVLEFS